MKYDISPLSIERHLTLFELRLRWFKKGCTRLKHLGPYLHGAICYDTKEVFVRDDLNDRNAGFTMLHELGHWICLLEHGGEYLHEWKKEQQEFHAIEQGYLYGLECEYDMKGWWRYNGVDRFIHDIHYSYGQISPLNYIENTTPQYHMYENI